MRLLFIPLALLIVSGCDTNSPNPLEEMITEERIKTTFHAFGRAFLESCDKQTDHFNAQRCQRDIGKAVQSARANGHQGVEAAHFTGEMVSRYLVTVKPLKALYKGSSVEFTYDW